MNSFWLENQFTAFHAVHAALVFIELCHYHKLAQTLNQTKETFSKREIVAFMSPFKKLNIRNLTRFSLTYLQVSDYHRSLRSLLSGYLLRKFKSSNGWQKLWVVFTHSCLYFFKTFQVFLYPTYAYKPTPSLSSTIKL